MQAAVIHVSLIPASAHAADGCAVGDTAGIAFVINVKDPNVETLAHDDTIEGQNLCVVVWPAGAGNVSEVTPQKTEITHEWYLNLQLDRSHEVRNVYSSTWRHALAILREEGKSESVSVNSVSHCARRASLELYPTALVTITLSGLPERNRSDVLFKSFEAEYLADPATALICDTNPSAEVSGDHPIRFKVPTAGQRVLDGKLRIQIRTPGPPLKFSIPLPELYAKESFKLLDYPDQKSKESTSIARNVSDDKDARASFLPSVVVSRSIALWPW